MKVTTLSDAGRTFASWIGGAALLALAPVAQAVPPSFSGQFNVPIPAIGQSVIVNLRQVSAVTGSAPIQIDTAQGIVLLGSAPSGLTIATFDPNGDNFGAVCVQITNGSYAPSTPGVLSAQLIATNGLGETVNTGLPGHRDQQCAGPNGESQ